MRIILSAFACSPQWGSEPGVGWRWANELARHHNVTVLTHAYFREHISAHPSDANSARIEFVYYEIPGVKIHPHKLLNSHIYYLLWQIGAWWKARGLVRGKRFDLVHHLTWATFKFPSFMGFLGVPFVYGPVGGAERAPLRLRRDLPIREALFEFARDVQLFIAYLDPLVWLSLRSANLILASTEETKKFISVFTATKIVVSQNIGCGDTPVIIPAAKNEEKKIVHLFYAGRLIGWKGVHFAIGALAKVRESGVDALLYIAGEGPMQEYLQKRAKILGVHDQVVFLGVVPRSQLLKQYSEMDLFIFPSLHDSGGTVVLEALASSLPVLCLDLGGPKYFVDSSCGRVIETTDRSEDDVITALAHEISNIARDAALHDALRAGAREKALRLSWESQVGKAYSVIQGSLFQES